MPSRAGPSSRSGGNEKRKTISLGMTMKWSPTLTTDLLDLIKANPDWRHTFFSRDSAKGHQWKEARDVLCLLCRKQEHGLMRRMEHFGLVNNSGRAEGGGIVWKPRDKWNRADIVTNRAESQLRRLRDDYDKMRAEHSIPDTVTTWKDIDKNIRGSLKSLNPFFIAVHNLRKYDDALTSHPLPANLVAGPSRTASSSRRLKEKPVPVKRRARASSSASSSGSSSVVIIDKPVVKRAKTELRSPSPHPRTRPIGTAPQEETDRKPNIALSTDTAPKRRLLTTMVDRPDVRYHSLEEAMNPAFGTKHRAPAENSLLSDTDSGTSSSTQSDIDPDELHERSSEAHEMSYCDGHIADMAMPDHKDVEGPEHISTSPGSHPSGSRSAASSARQGGSNRTTMSPANGLLSTSVPVQPALQPRIQIRDSVIQHTYDLPAGIPKEELLAIARDTSEEHPVVRPDTAVDGRLRLRMSNLPRGSRTSMGMHRDNQVAIYIALWSRETAMRELLRILPIRHYNFARHPVNGRGGALGSDSRRLFGVTRAVFIELGRRDKRLRRGKSPGTALRINGLSDPSKPVDEVDLATAERCNMMEFWRAIDRLVQSLPPDVQRRMVR